MSPFWQYYILFSKKGGGQRPSNLKFHSVIFWTLPQERGSQLESLQQDDLKFAWMKFDVCVSEAHQDCLWQRIPATVVVVDAVVGDVFSDLTANRAQHYQGSCHTEQLLIALRHHHALNAKAWFKKGSWKSKNAKASDLSGNQSTWDEIIGAESSVIKGLIREWTDEFLKLVWRKINTFNTQRIIVLLLYCII